MPSLMATLGLNGEGFAAGLSAAELQANRSGTRISSALSGAVTGGIAAIGSGMLLRGAFDLGNRIRALSEEFQISYEEAQKWDVAASHLNLTAEQMGQVFLRLKKAREEALTGKDTQRFINEWGQFGVSLDQLKNSSMSMSQIMDQLFSTTQGRILSDEEDAALYDLMGMRGEKILAAFQELKNLGPIQLLTDEQVQNLSQGERSFDSMLRTGKIIFGEGWFTATKAAPEEASALWQFIKGGLGMAGAGERMVFPMGEGLSTSGGEPAGGKIYSASKTVKLKQDEAELARLQELLTEKIFQNSLRTMTVEQQRVALKKQIADLEKDSAEALFSEGDKARSLKDQIKIGDLKAQLDNLDKSATSGHALSRLLDLNPMQRVGAYAQAPPGFQQLAEHIKEGVRHLLKIEGNTTPRMHRGPRF